MKREALMDWLSRLPEDADISVHKDGCFLVAGDHHPFFEIEATQGGGKTAAPAEACHDPRGHEWQHTGTVYGGSDPSGNGAGRCVCIYCGASGDA